MNVADLSRSYVEYMDKNERKTIIITWPRKIKTDLSKVKIIIKESANVF
jgi:hypothetical protein